jgi:SAM-dependent methyltransferase
MKNSSSFHKIDAYKGLSHYGKIIYLVYNLLSNTFPNTKIDKRINLKKFIKKDLTYYANDLDSPSRRLCDIFWSSLPWHQINQELCQINVMDIGCGDGNYASKLNDFANDSLNKYYGIDINTYENWKILLEHSPEYYSFNNIKNNINNLEIFDSANLIISQSSMEHIENDLEYFRNIHKYTQGKTDPVIQIHLIPASEALYIYPFHGIRQYTIRKISKITRLFDEHSSFYLYALGGKNTNTIHKDYIGNLVHRIKDKRKNMPKKYATECLEAIRKDLSMEGTNKPSFYALIIHSNPKNRIFDDLS